MAYNVSLGRLMCQRTTQPEDGKGGCGPRTEVGGGDDAGRRLSVCRVVGLSDCRTDLRGLSVRSRPAKVKPGRFGSVGW